MATGARRKRKVKRENERGVKMTFSLTIRIFEISEACRVYYARNVFSPKKSNGIEHHDKRRERCSSIAFRPRKVKFRTFVKKKK